MGNREVARFQLQLAPRHVITPQHKKDILKNAFRLQRPSKEQSSKILSKDKSKSKSLHTYLLELEYFLYRTIRDFFSLIPYSVYHLDTEFILRQHTFRLEKSVSL